MNIWGIPEIIDFFNSLDELWRLFVDLVYTIIGAGVFSYLIIQLVAFQTSEGNKRRMVMIKLIISSLLFGIVVFSWVGISFSDFFIDFLN